MQTYRQQQTLNYILLMFVCNHLLQISVNITEDAEMSTNTGNEYGICQTGSYYIWCSVTCKQTRNFKARIYDARLTLTGLNVDTFDRPTTAAIFRRVILPA